MVCLSVELQRARFIKELSEVSLLIMEKEVRPTDAALLLTELVIQCCTLYLDVLSVMIVYSLLNISLWI